MGLEQINVEMAPVRGKVAGGWCRTPIWRDIGGNEEPGTPEMGQTPDSNRWATWTWRLVEFRKRS